MTTKRKAYVRPMTSTWWKKLPFYRFYMLREGTAVPAVWFSIELIQFYLNKDLGGVISPATFDEPCPFMENPYVSSFSVFSEVTAFISDKIVLALSVPFTFSSTENALSS